MQDNQLIELFLPIITAGLAAQGYTGVICMQSNQPTQQGMNSAPTVFFQKLNDHRYGFPLKEDVWNSKDSIMVHTETQVYETVFQFNAWVLQNPTSPSYTASDLLNVVAAILQADTTIQTLEQNNVGVLRVTDLTNNYFVDDADNYEASPSFDCTLTHKQIITTMMPIVNSFDYEIHRV